MPKFGHFGPKVLNFYRMYPISNELISNLTLVFENCELKSLNMDILCQKGFNFLMKFCQ